MHATQPGRVVEKQPLLIGSAISPGSRLGLPPSQPLTHVPVEKEDCRASFKSGVEDRVVERRRPRENRLALEDGCREDMPRAKLLAVRRGQLEVPRLVEGEAEGLRMGKVGPKGESDVMEVDGAGVIRGSVSLDSRAGALSLSSIASLITHFRWNTGTVRRMTKPI